MRKCYGAAGGLVQLCVGKSRLCVFARSTRCLLLLGSAAGSSGIWLLCPVLSRYYASDVLQASCMPCRSFLALAVHLRRSRTDLAGLPSKQFSHGFAATYAKAAGDSVLPSKPEPARTSAHPMRTRVAPS